MTQQTEKNSLPRKIRDDLALQIRSGVLPVGKPLPSFTELCTHYGASRFSVNAAMRLLEAERLIHTRNRRPALVCKNPAQPRLKCIALASTFPCEDFHYDSSPQVWELYQALLSEAMSHDCQCLTLRADRLGQLGDHADGAILFGFPHQRFALPDDLGTVPRVRLSLATDDAPDNAVSLRRSTGILQSALYFLSHGVKSILLWGLPDHTKHDVAAIFTATLLEHGIDAQALTVHISDAFETEAAYASVREYLAAAPVLPLGILTGGDFSAGGAAQACLEHGLKLKEDFFVVGLTDLPETARRRPALSVQSVPYRELAASSLAMLERLIASGQPQPSEVLDNRIIIRET